MKLVRVPIVNVEETITKSKSIPMYFTSKGLKSGKEHEISIFLYTFTGTNGTIYRMRTCSFQKVMALKEIMCFIGYAPVDNEPDEPAVYLIKDGKLLNEKEFQKVKSEYTLRIPIPTPYSRKKLILFIFCLNFIGLFLISSTAFFR